MDFQTVPLSTLESSAWNTGASKEFTLTRSQLFPVHLSHSMNRSLEEVLGLGGRGEIY